MNYVDIIEIRRQLQNIEGQIYYSNEILIILTNYSNNTKEEIKSK